MPVKACHLLKICRAENCRLAGSEDLVRHIEERLGSRLNQTTPDGAITFEHIFCLGRCRDAPAMMLDGVVVANVTPGQADGLIDTALGKERRADGKTACPTR